MESYSIVTSACHYAAVEAGNLLMRALLENRETECDISKALDIAGI